MDKTDWIMNKIRPLDTWDWETMHIRAECPSVGLIEGGIGITEEDWDDNETVQLAKSVLKLSMEIKRLRLTYGEEVWQPVGMSNEDMAEQRRLYEKEKT